VAGPGVFFIKKLFFFFVLKKREKNMDVEKLWVL